jgi:fructokinase
LRIERIIWIAPDLRGELTEADPRVRPLVSLDRATVEAMCAPIGDGVALRDVVPVGEGLVNTLLRVTTTDGRDYALRVAAPDEELGLQRTEHRLAAEISLLGRLACGVPVPRPIVTDLHGALHGFAFAIYPWIDGMTLNACRRQHGSAALQSLAEPLGTVSATIAAAPGIDRSIVSERSSVSDALDLADRHLRSSLVRERLGSVAADALRARLDAHRTALDYLDRHTGLVHGDFSGRNIIVSARVRETWEIAGVLDWENAFLGSPLWDVGSLFRYSTRYSTDFRYAFARGYRDAGGELPEDWWTLSRLLDATGVVGILAGDRELSSVFDDCRSIVANLM